MPLTNAHFSFHHHFASSVDSTNLELIKRLQKEDLLEGSLLQTDFQIDGKGQGSATWESEDAKNLIFSFVLKPGFLEIEKQFYISIVVSLAMMDMLSEYLPDNTLYIKWPNDIYVGQKKIAGILIESAIQGDNFEWVVIGIGLNVNQVKFVSNAPNPISLNEILHKTIDLEEVLSRYETHFANRYQQLKNGEFSRLKSEYLQRMYQYNKWMNYKSADTVFQGKIIGIDEYGFLRIQTSHGERIFDVKEVRYL